MPRVSSDNAGDGDEPVNVAVYSECGAHGQHQLDLDHYLKVQFLYNRDATAHIKHTLQPLIENQRK